MNILVTGGAGFIGSHIVDYLLKNTKYKIKIVDNLFSGSLNNIKHNLKYYPDRLNFIYGDISNLEVCRKVSKNIDLICHQAAVGSVPRSIEDPLTSHNSNINANIQINVKRKSMCSHSNDKIERKHTIRHNHDECEVSRSSTKCCRFIEIRNGAKVLIFIEFLYIVFYLYIMGVVSYEHATASGKLMLPSRIICDRKWSRHGWITDSTFY